MSDDKTRAEFEKKIRESDLPDALHLDSAFFGWQAAKELYAPREVELLCRDALVMANARRLMKTKRITSNGRLYMELFGTGLGTGRDRCRELGLDPDSNKTSHYDMVNSIEARALIATKEPQ